MIEKIKSEIEKLMDGYEHSCVDNAYQRGVSDGAKWIKKKAIEIVQEVAKEYGWIPVEVAMPTEEGWYRVTCEDKEIWKEPIVRDLYYYPTLNSFIDNIRYSEHGCNDIMKYDWTKYVTAWKPLDTPYKKGE